MSPSLSKSEKIFVIPKLDRQGHFFFFFLFSPGKRELCPGQKSSLAPSRHWGVPLELRGSSQHDLARGKCSRQDPALTLAGWLAKASSHCRFNRFYT